jgi:hypothetical protein
LLAQGKVEEARQSFQEALKDRRREDGTYDLEKAGPDSMTAAYFLDLIAEQKYIDHLAGDKHLACFPWFYVAQRREIEGNQQAAIAAYRRCVELQDTASPHFVASLAQYRLRTLNGAPESSRE